MTPAVIAVDHTPDTTTVATREHDGKRCMVLGCPREGVFCAVRNRPSRHGDLAVPLYYCAEHYSAANRFHNRGNARGHALP